MPRRGPRRPLGRLSEREGSIRFAVTDKNVLKQISFPVVGEDDLETSLGNLSAAVSEDWASADYVSLSGIT